MPPKYPFLPQRFLNHGVGNYGKQNKFATHAELLAHTKEKGGLSGCLVLEGSLLWLLAKGQLVDPAALQKLLA